MSTDPFSDIHLGGIPSNLNKDLLAAKSSTLSKLFEENPEEDLSHLLYDIPTTPQIFELIARFCYGFHVNFTPENIIPVYCLASYLGMTETHSPNNLVNEALFLFEHEIITGWNKCLRSLKAIENSSILQQAEENGLVDTCMDSIINKALDNPLLLGKPIKNPVLDDAEDDQELNGNASMSNVLDWKSEDLSLTTLHLEFYECIIHGMVECKVGSNYISSNLYQYAKRRAFIEPKETDEDTSCPEGSNSRKAVIEAIERLLPHDLGILPCALLLEMLQNATVLEANVNCREGFEVRIGRQLDLATVDDLIILSRGNSKERKYDIECFRRIFKHFCNHFTGQDQSRLDIVAELVEGLLAEVVKDIDLKNELFISLAEISIDGSKGAQRSTDGYLWAIGVYLNKHKCLTGSERKESLRVLSCNNMPPEASEHAVQSKRLPEFVAVQTPEDMEKESNSKSMEDEDVNEEEEMKVKLEKLSHKVMELEKESLMLRKKIQRNYCSCGKKTMMEEKTDVLEGIEEEDWLQIEVPPAHLEEEEEGSSKVKGNDDFINLLFL